ncbi:MAG: hypothetical protein CVV05_01450 [Gammaproteobacteria bacterium HGW-Gammaproteobacteria-1]|jgi:hypothetical protein|nr:MAG: hypothetical protein CVV05_01450 [Gammaproteobacteria bacterium HGW-Gammaproteobacteria-1]
MDQIAVSLMIVLALYVAGSGIAWFVSFRWWLPARTQRWIGGERFFGAIEPQCANIPTLKEFLLLKGVVWGR